MSEANADKSVNLDEVAQPASSPPAEPVTNPDVKLSEEAQSKVVGGASKNILIHQPS